MATANTVQLQASQGPQYYREGISNESTKTASQILQENHEQHHIYFNNRGFHNHIVHQMLTMWALKATPDQLQRGYDHNKSYQRPMMKPNQSVIQELNDPAKFLSYLGPEKHYNDFMIFFQGEIEKTSWQDVLNKYLFAGDELADTMLVRMYAGVVHSLIHLGFGIEFQQPAIIAESLAQAACHSDWIGDLFLPAEKAAKERSDDTGSKSIVQLLHEIHDDKAMREAVKYSDGLNKFRQGLLGVAKDRTIHYASQVRVKPQDLEEKTAEMTNAAIYYTGGAALRPNKHVKFDFFYMHAVNCSIFFSTFLKQDWLSEANKVRLLEWKIRLDLAMYAEQGSPEINLKGIRSYRPKKPSGWDEVEDRACALDDDGHGPKLIRAIANGAKICKPYEAKDSFPIKGDDWLKLAHMAIDSVELSGDWVRGAGFDEAWENIPPQPKL